MPEADQRKKRLYFLEHRGHICISQSVSTAGSNADLFITYLVTWIDHLRLFLSQIMDTDGEVDVLSKAFLKNRNNFELYVPYSANRQFSESTLNSYEVIRKFFDVIIVPFSNWIYLKTLLIFKKILLKEINLRSHKIDDFISDYLNKPLDRIVQYRQFIQEQIKYTVRAKQNSSMLQEAYFMFCDIFKIIETRQLVNSIQNLPLELATRFEKLNRFVSFFLLESLLKAELEKFQFVNSQKRMHFI